MLSYSFVKSLPPSNIDIQSRDGRRHRFTCSIVGFSDINTILVPNEFLLWANKEFGDGDHIKPNKILVQFNDPSSPDIIEYLEDNNYEINEKELEFNKLINVFKIAFLFVFLISIVIIILAIAFIMLSVNLIFQKNKQVLTNLYNIGYNIKQISFFYKIVISIVSLFSLGIAVICSILIRNIYINQLSSYFDFEVSNMRIFMFVLLVFVVLSLFLNYLIVKKIKKIITSY